MLIDIHASVLASNPWSRFSYFFVIERFLPSFADLRVSDLSGAIRIGEQMFTVAPFYSGVAYSIGALAAEHNALLRIFGSREAAEEATEEPVLRR